MNLDLWTAAENGTGTVGHIELHPLIGTPLEGTGSSSSNTSDGAGTGVTWNSRTGQTTADNLWSTPGGDYSATILSTIAGFDATVANAPEKFRLQPRFRRRHSGRDQRKPTDWFDNGVTHHRTRSQQPLRSIRLG